jgi:hypothetical protein
MHKRHKICSWSSANHKDSLHLYWGAHKEWDLYWSKTSMNDHKDLVHFFTIKSSRRRDQYKLFKVHHNLGDSWSTPSPSRRQVPKRNEHTEIIDEVLEGWMGHSREMLKSLLVSLDWSEAWEREVLTSRKVGSNCIQVNWLANRAGGEGGLL